MKFTIAPLVLLLCIAGRINAQTIPYDSLTIDSLYGSFGGTGLYNIEGPPDRAVATLTSSSVVSAQFFAGSELVTFQKGAAMHVYWLRLNNTDSAAADINFVELKNGGLVRSTITPIRIMEGGPVNVLQETTINIPDTGYNTLQITIGADTGASICWIDAVSLIQSGVAAVDLPLYAAATMQCYPNPVEHGSSASIELSAPVSGRAELVVFDELGQEIEHVPVGELSAGTSEIATLRLERAGVFFARLIIDGWVVGTPLKWVAK